MTIVFSILGKPDMNLMFADVDLLRRVNEALARCPASSKSTFRQALYLMCIVGNVSGLRRVLGTEHSCIDEVQSGTMTCLIAAPDIL